MVGCFFISFGGLRSYEYFRNELKLVFRVDSLGEVCGVNFKVDSDFKKESKGMLRIGSVVDWFLSY